MARHPRVHVSGLLYHVMARGNNGQEIYSEKKDYEVFLEQLREARQRYPFYLYAYVLMPNHFHLLLEVMELPTARIMQSLLTGYVRRFNRKHRRKGHLFQGRYKAIVCDRDSYLLELVRYIHLNPLRARLVRRPADWQWSGHGEYLGTSKNGLIDAGAVMEEFKTPNRYEAFVRAGVKEPYREEWHPGDHAPFLGKEDFVKKVAAPKRQNGATRPAKLDVLLKAKAREAGLKPQAVARPGKSRTIGEVRRDFIEAAVLEQGYQASEVAIFLGCHASSVSRALQRQRSKI